MTTEKVVLITGAAGQWGTRLAKRLVVEDGLGVVALDDQPPSPGLAGLDYLQADFQDPLIGDLLATEAVHTVCHLAFRPSVARSEDAYAHNVQGTARFLAACLAAGVRHVVLMSSTAVYGAHADNPVLLQESHPLRGSRRQGTNRDRLEIEAFVNGFYRQHPEMLVTVLRLANIVGPTADTPMTRYLRSPAGLTLMGFNPLLQLIHEQDVAAALAQAVLAEKGGIYNVAAEPALPLKRLLALAGTLPVPVFHPLAYLNNSIQEQMVFEPDSLRYRWIADTEKMQTELGFFPEKSAEEAVQALRAAKGEPLPAGGYRPDGSRQSANDHSYAMPLDEIMAHRQKARERETTTAAG